MFAVGKGFQQSRNVSNELLKVGSENEDSKYYD
jgi:hypothetical protein